MPDISAAFRRMADNIDLNKDNPFGGALVVVPPNDETTGESATPLEVLIVDSQQSAAQFWATIKFKAEMALRILDEKSRTRQMGQGGRY